MLVKSVFLSDIHAGSEYCQADKVIRLLSDIQYKNLFLVGDTIDDLTLQFRFWSEKQKRLIKFIWGLSENHTVIAFRGNHDPFEFPFSPTVLGKVIFVNHLEYTTEDNNSLFIIHGDQFDLLTQTYYRMHKMGQGWNDWFDLVDHFFNTGLWPKFQLCFKRFFRQTVSVMDDFERNLIHFMKDRGYNRVLLGHTHIPCHKQIHGIEYFNCGDWFSSLSFVVEHLDGKLELMYYKDLYE